jgi:hypothetical protein
MILMDDFIFANNFMYSSHKNAYIMAICTKASLPSTAIPIKYKLVYKQLEKFPRNIELGELI